MFVLLVCIFLYLKSTFSNTVAETNNRFQSPVISVIGDWNVCVASEVMGIEELNDNTFQRSIRNTLKPCEFNELPCNNGQCVYRNEWCDGFEDCDDTSDEDYCSDTGNFLSDNCDQHEFECANEDCIHFSNRCDGIPDCADGSDEASCPITSKDCDANEFKCSNGACILQFKRCNGNLDCADGSDEALCARKDCNTNEFKCGNGECILRFKKCNGHIDCADGSDEDSCGRPKNDDIFTIIPDVEEHLSEPLAAENAVRWILSQRQSDYAWEEDTPRALIALRLAQTKLINKAEIQLATQQLLSNIAMDLVRNKSGSALSIHKLAQYVNALVASCGNPRNFLGFSLVDILRTQADETLKKEYISPGVFLALCVANQTRSTDFKTVYQMLDSYVGPQRRNGRLYGFESYVAVVAACMLNSPEYNHIELFRVLLNNTVFNYFFNVQDSDVHTISLLVQALNAWSSDPIGQALQNERQILFQALLKRQRSDGSFGDFLSTYFALPALNGKSFASLKHVECLSGSNIASYYQYHGGEVINTRISLWVTTPYGTDVNSITFHVLSTWTLYDAMKLASAKNTLFKFDHEETKVGKAVYRISDLPNDGEANMYWNLYINKLTDVTWAKKVTLNNSSLFRDPRYMPDRQGMDTYVLKENDDIVFWYRPLY